MKPPYAIGSVPSLSGHAVANRWRSLPRVRRHRAIKPQGSSERVLPWQITMDQLIFASLSHTHYWYEVGMLKVPAVVNTGDLASKYNIGINSSKLGRSAVISSTYSKRQLVVMYLSSVESFELRRSCTEVRRPGFWLREFFFQTRRKSHRKVTTYI